MFWKILSGPLGPRLQGLAQINWKSPSLGFRGECSGTVELGFWRKDEEAQISWEEAPEEGEFSWMEERRWSQGSPGYAPLSCHWAGRLQKVDPLSLSLSALKISHLFFNFIFCYKCFVFFIRNIGFWASFNWLFFCKTDIRHCAIWCKSL